MLMFNKLASSRQVSILAGTSLLFAVLLTAEPARQKTGYSAVGTAVYYNDKMNGKTLAAKGEKYDSNAITAATH